MILNNRAACRICLCTNVKFYPLEVFQLKTYYEEITNEVLTKDDELLHFFCYQCSALLQKYHSFRQLCIKSQATLKKVTTQNLNISFEATLKWEQYNSKIHPLLMKLNSTAKLGYFEYEENDITVDDPFVNNSIQYYAYSDVEEKFEFKFDKHNSDDNNDGIENVFEESISQESNNVDITTSSVSDKKYNFYYNNDASENDFEKSTIVPVKSISDFEEKPKSKKPNSKVAKRKSNGCRKKESKPIPILDPTKWKKKILSNEDAAKEFDAKIEKQRNGPYKHICELCQMCFLTLGKFNKHMVYHSEAKGNYECFFCKKRYATRTKLVLHIKLHLERYCCLQCPQVFSSKTHTNLHEKYHEGVNYVCPHCNVTFQKRTTYYGHLRIIHRSSHLCQFCGASFVSKMGLDYHRNRAHKSKDTGDFATYCEKCDMIFENPQAFEEHERNSAKHVTWKEDVFGQSNLKLLKGDTEREEKCDQCAERFSSSKLLERHMRLVHHAPRKQYESATRRTICEICGSSVLLYQLQTHMDCRHAGKLYPCPDCGKSYNNISNMRRHHLRHKNPRRFSCELCGKKLTTRGGVKLHVRTVHLKQPHPPRNRTKMKFASLGKTDE